MGYYETAANGSEAAQGRGDQPIKSRAIPVEVRNLTLSPPRSGFIFIVSPKFTLLSAAVFPNEPAATDPWPDRRRKMSVILTFLWVAIVFMESLCHKNAGLLTQTVHHSQQPSVRDAVR